MSDSPLTLKDWQNSGQYFEFNNHRVFYQDTKSNNDEVVLLIHGFPTSSWDWYKVWPTLSASYRLVAPDMLGYGWSDKPADHAYSILEQADLVEALLKTLNINRVRIIAHDYGDTVTQELMARYQNNEQTHTFSITSVVLTNGGLFPEVHRPRLVQKLLLSPIGALICRLQTRSKFGKSFDAIFGAHSKPTEQELDEFWSLICFNQGIYRFNKLIHYINERVQYRERWVGALISPSFPVRFINGLDDPISGEHMLVRYEELVANPDVVRLPGIGHYPQVEDADSVLTAITSFHNAHRG